MVKTHAIDVLIGPSDASYMVKASRVVGDGVSQDGFLLFGCFNPEFKGSLHIHSITQYLEFVKSGGGLIPLSLSSDSLLS